MNIGIFMIFFLFRLIHVPTICIILIQNKNNNNNKNNISKK